MWNRMILTIGVLILLSLPLWSQQGEIEYAIQPQFDDAWDFSDGLARVRIGGKWGYVNKEGQVVIKPQFDDIWDFSGGLARVRVDGKYGYINREGQYVIKPQFDGAGTGFSEGLAPVKKDGKWGYISKVSFEK